MKYLETLINKINKIVTFLGGLAIAFMMIHISLDILARFLFNTPLPGTITIVAHYYMLIAIFLPLAYAEQTNSSIAVEILTTKFSHKTQHRLNGWTYLLISATAFVMTSEAFKVAIKNYHSNTSVMQGDYTIITWPSYFILCAGTFLLGSYCLLRFLSFLTRSERAVVAEAAHV
ncbi:TRAP-type C4-dicarboxylate transport system, small permease component [Marinobacter sp. DSM 26671]|jgi:TRAP-type C4-dicarboxylate transport system permease small subunit|uniref:TRAP transporter small permease n=1 Tax=unclassified Marinobacter TaxID=83889 RepID=UPI00069FB5A6|nr:MULTISPECIES: TRAP transporter small permease [unclassified Marinobacter]AKV98161.1 hypothetical protein ACP86_19585 [Marinobacter sp. CP1]SFE98394.1 TRAP-type C4-dicarboxylate transport system, small permease component [Marinobacter sp. DSM 26671]|tara:strand:+ start:1797 stop:2318 length:522 start_codon:yes stop_codon:yes gene_type:complete